MADIPQLREKQIEQLAAYIANPKFLDLSEPATGKTPPCCVYAFYVWKRLGKKTWWTMPKSLLKKNLKEMLRFTEFTENDVVILKSDFLPMTKSWRGPTMVRTKRVPTYKVRQHLTGTESDTHTMRLRYGKPVKFVHLVDGQWVKLCGSGLPVRVEPLEIGPDGKPVKQWVDVPEVVRDMIAAAKGAKVFISTFKFGAQHWERMLQTHGDIDLLLVDELHMPGGYSTPTSEATQSFYHINRHVSRFVGMTGTLINGRLDSAFPAIHVIEPRYYGSYQGFIYEHCLVMDDYDRVILWKNEAKLGEIIRRHSIRRTFEEVYGKENVAFFTEYVDVGEEVLPHYKEFHEQAMLELENGEVLDGTLPGVALIRAQQILGHPETMGLNGDKKWTEKDERLMVHLAEGKKTIIFAQLQPEQERIVRLCEELGLRVGLINGNVTGGARDRVNDLAEAGELDVIVASGPTAAVGFNWSLFDHVIFASIDYQDVNILQAYRRAIRGVRAVTLRVTFMQYRDTIDQRKYKIVKSKSELANRVDPTRRVLEFQEAQ